MLLMNRSMKIAFKSLSLDGVKLDLNLKRIVSSGFIKNGKCYLIKKCFEQDTNATSGYFPDEIGYECFINSVNIDDFVNRDVLEQGVIFIQRVFEQWQKFDEKHVLVAICSKDEISLKVKFYLQREGEAYLSDNLEGYEDAIFMTDSQTNLLSTLGY